VIPGSNTPRSLLQIGWRLKWWIDPLDCRGHGVAAWTWHLKDVYRSDTLIMVVPQRVPKAWSGRRRRRAWRIACRRLPSRFSAGPASSESSRI
jgi:hypothetical protein